MLSERTTEYENRPPEGAKAARGGVKHGLRESGGSFVPGPNFAARAVRKPCLGGSGGALGTLVALLEPSWGPPGASRAAPGRLLGSCWDPSRADLDDLDDVCGAT